MKLYIWNNPYTVSWGGTYGYAVARNVAQARSLLLKSRVISYGAYIGELPDNLDIDRPPDAIHDLPFAEIYEWSE